MLRDLAGMAGKGREAVMVRPVPRFSQGMDEWITDRQPTEADGDSDADVSCKRHPDQQGSHFIHWSHIGAGVPWKHTSYWQPPAQPEPEPEPEPEPTPTIPAHLRVGVVPFYVLVVSDDSGGQAIVFEHEIPNNITIESVLRHQQNLGDRYGTTYVAECRILPELTRHA